jgi:hypothetical protein
MMRVGLTGIFLSLVLVTACDGSSGDQAHSRTTATTSFSASARVPPPPLP